ncbi:MULTISPECIES: hypothetical protein [Flavobacterium]|uniref:hypothetical protein n=1 Tax=Flavobacterium TaxID=237 RepID=UPI001FCBB170|nr:MULTISPECIES: hypothetical protein [Flavobacterium]UOK41600.1 hypothetical protein LZF87_09785 [Flavobacterium enshiense]
MKTLKFNIKHLAIFSIIIQIVTLLIFLIVAGIFKIPIIEYILNFLGIFYFFFFFISLNKFFEKENPYNKLRFKNILFLILCFPIIYIFLFLIVTFSDIFTNQSTEEDVELYKVENYKLTKTNKIKVENGEVTETDTLAVIYQNDTIKFKPN